MTARAPLGRLIPTAAVRAAYDRIAADGRPGIWIELIDQRQALAAAEVVEGRLAAGEDLALAGLTAAVKGNIDVAGWATTAGCPDFGAVPAVSAPAVVALERAGAVVVGITNLDQFATGLVGTRSPHGICPNAFWPELISGGSSSGSAVAVAAGMVDLALGTDTAGSGRVPAAANGIVGLKPTRGAVSRAGVVPACRSLDCVSVFARTVEVASAAFDALALTVPDDADPWAARPAPRDRGPLGRGIRIGAAPVERLSFDGDPDGAPRYWTMIDQLQQFGLDIEPVELAPFLAAGDLLYEGAFLAQRYEAVGHFVDAHRDRVDPVVGEIISAGARVTGWEVFRDLAELERLRSQAEPLWDRIDVLAVPTVPRLPTLAEVLDDPFGPNRMLGRYTNFVNMLDLCAFTLPMAEITRATDRPADPSGVNASGPPPSLTFIAPAWSESLLIDLATRVMAGPVA